jgi:hypothetical protein
VLDPTPRFGYLVARAEVPAKLEMGDELTAEDLVAAYNDVFAIKGGAVVSRRGVHVEYAEDLLRRAVEVPAFRPLNLTEIRNVPKGQLVRLLFKAVAGHFIAGPSSLRGDVCRLLADPVSGSLELTRDGGEDVVVLTVISLILLAVVLVMLCKRRDPEAPAI